jgi:calcium/proton exchanger cax
VLLTLVLGYVPTVKDLVGPVTKFILGTVSVMPLSYLIGMSIANISAQSSFAVGAILNATFGSIVELTLYYISLRQGLADLVMAALTGTLLATMLLIPGLCMIIGGLKYKDQRFNLKSAGVSSALLFVSIAGAYTPSLFQKMHGSSHMTCTGCNDGGGTARAGGSTDMYALEDGVGPGACWG